MKTYLENLTIYKAVQEQIRNLNGKHGGRYNMNMREKITELIRHIAAYEKLKGYRKTVTAQMFGKPDEEKNSEDRKKGTPVLEGISFRYKTVQFHMIDDTFEEIKKAPEIFGDVEIYSERFSLPGWGVKSDDLNGDEYQFEIIALIKSKKDKETYYVELQKVMDAISKKHNVEIIVEPTEEFYNINHITFYTSEEGVFSKD